MNQPQSLRQSKDNFYKKVSSSKGFQYQAQTKSQTYSTIIQILKSDLIQLQDMINTSASSSDIKKYQLLSVTPGLSNKLTEIVKSPRINDIIDKLEKDSQNIEAISKNYNTQSTKELISKLFLELNYNELLNRKLCDYFLLIKLKLLNDHTYQDSLSRILPIKEFVDKLVPKLQNANSSSNQSQTSNSSSNNKSVQIEKEYNEFIKIATLNEILETDTSKNKLYHHCFEMVNKYFQNMNFSTNKFILEINKGKNKLNELKGTEIEKYFKLKAEIESLLKKMQNDFEITKQTEINLNKQIQDLQDRINKLENTNKTLTTSSSSKTENSNLKYTETQYLSMQKTYQNELTKKETEFKTDKQKLTSANHDLLKENNSLKEQLQLKENEIKKLSSSQKQNIQNNNNDISTINTNINIEELLKKHENEFKKIQADTSKKLDTEITELNTQIALLNEKYNNILLENQNLKKQVDIFKSKSFNPESYEQVLLEQFETMKSAFMKKLETANEELSQVKSSTRIKLFNMENELKETKNLKDVFLKQVIQLQKKLNI